VKSFVATGRGHHGGVGDVGLRVRGNQQQNNPVLVADDVERVDRLPRSPSRRTVRPSTASSAGALAHSPEWYRTR
jgi:hypothetical protein